MSANISNTTWSLRDLRLSHHLALLALLLIAIGFGINVEIRSALLQNRHTDVGTYFAAAWSIRTGSDPYFARDTNGWHYIYPPLLAVLLTPLADAPPGMHRYWLLPYAASVAIWYILSIAFMVFGVDRLARALVKAMPGQTPAQMARQWWFLFFWPIVFCLPAIGRSLVRGQVGPLWLVLLCMATACIIQKKYFRAGLWLSGAICLKVIPLFLLLYPLWRRQYRMMAGTAVGLLLGLILIPTVAMGPKQFVTANRHYLHSIVLPGATGKRIDPAMEHELLDPVTSDTQSFVTLLMNNGNFLFGTPRTYTPPLYARLGHWIIAASLVIGTLWAAGRKRAVTDPINEAIFFGILCVINLPIAPVCHPHYFMLMIPLVMAVLATGVRSVGWIALVWSLPVSHMLTTSPGIQLLRDVGVVTWVATIFCIAAMLLLRHRTKEPRVYTQGFEVIAPVPS